MLESDDILTGLFVAGEISNFSHHYQTGHLYMSLKDNESLVRTVMFRPAASRLRFAPQNGMSVICRGRVSLFERDGAYQFYIEDMQPDGVGSLALSFEQLRDRLRKEGLFDEAKKRPVPRYPEKIAVITSPAGAALQDIIHVLRRRYPVGEVVLCPVAVQGESAAPQIIGAIEAVNRQNAADVIIVGRGGGSLEELWAFNSEELSRAVHASKIPVISAVGHETDFTVCDFVADLRAPTPSAAAELAAPSVDGLLSLLASYQQRLKTAVLSRTAAKKAALSLLTARPPISSPFYFIEHNGRRLASIAVSLLFRYKQRIAADRNRLAVLASGLDALSPLKRLSGGYAAPLKNGKAIKSAASLSRGDEISLVFADGKAECVVKEVNI